MMAKCLRCRAGNEWIEGDPPKSESKTLSDIRALLDECRPDLDAFEAQIAEGCDIGDSEGAFAWKAKHTINAMMDRLGMKTPNGIAQGREHSERPAGAEGPTP